MKCYFENEYTITIKLNEQIYYEIYEDDLLIHKDIYYKETKLNVNYKLDTQYYIKINDYIKELDYDGIYDTDLFNTYNYDGTLGVEIKDKIFFSVWAPLKYKIDLIIYVDNEEKVFTMNKENGVFKANINLEYLNNYYMYRIYNKNETIEVIDPYAICVIDNKGYLIDLNTTIKLEYLKRNINDNQRIIYELHISDFTYQLINKEKYLGLIEENKNKGLNHLIDLGITDIQLLPIFDFEHNNEYNWGYMPLNYNSLSSVYALNKHNKINEFKKVVKAYHDNNIGVIMDVVYNHTSSKHSFDKFVPGYYYRKTNNEYCNASGCGNEIASTRYMVRKYIIDSVCFWSKEYKIDGFRFDLMAILDVYTMNKLKEELKCINKDILIYGEPWGADSINISSDIQANKNNIDKLENIHIFNDTLRDAIKGNVFDKYHKGFIQGDNYYKNIILQEINKKTINYVSCHDNHTLFDKLSFTSNNKIEQQKQANTIVLLSKGITFLHCGVEICRTKNLLENTYNSSIEINKLDWNDKDKYFDVFNYYKNIIKFKKKLHIDEIKQYEFYIDSIISYKINNYIIIHNGATNNYIKFNKEYTLVFHNKECNISVFELYLELNNTYIIKELD